jgi:hypothetical protein
MPQGNLCKVIEYMLDKDTGTNVHQVHVSCSLDNIYQAWAAVTRRKAKFDQRRLKVTATDQGFMIEIDRPVPPDPNIHIMK